MLTNALIAAVATLSTCALPQGDLNDPHTWGNYFLDKYATERAEAMNIEPASTPPLAHPRTVLLITGVTIPAEWFDPIKARLERDGFRTVVYEPPALLSGDLFTNSDKLAAVIAGIEAATGETKIDILAECTGGLIARYYIQALGGDQHVSRLVTFISPQHGLPKASLAGSFVTWDAVQDLTPGSDFLETVNNAPLPSTVPVTSIYSCTDEYIQPYATSIIPGAKNIGLCDGTFVGHFQFFYDREIYKIMHAELTTPVPGDPAPSTNPTPEADPNDPADPAADETSAGGCSSTHGSNGAGGLAVVALALVWRRRRSRR